MCPSLGLTEPHDCIETNCDHLKNAKDGAQIVLSKEG